MNFPILTTLIFLPLVSSFFIFLSKGQKNDNSAIYISLFSSLATFILSLFVWFSRKVHRIVNSEGVVPGVGGRPPGKNKRCPKQR